MKILRIEKVRAKNIFVRSRIPGIDWVINQYFGCDHACLYCYAKFLTDKMTDINEPWGSWAIVKENAPELVKNKYVSGIVMMSSVSDPYQNLEKNLMLTQRVLKAMDKRIKLRILTKSSLVLRDMRIFKLFRNIEVGLTINNYLGKTELVLEPYASRIRDRINALKALKRNEIQTFAFISPVIPVLSNVEEAVESVYDYVDYFVVELINIRKAGSIFLKWLQRNYPESYRIIVNDERIIQFAKELAMNLTRKYKSKFRSLITHRKRKIRIGFQELDTWFKPR